MNHEHNRSTEQDTTTWKESPYLFIKGFLMGSADIVPGVSGGTMALIVGIYERLIYAIKSVDLQVFRNVVSFKLREAIAGIHWRFLIILLAGIFAAIIFFSRVVPLQIYMFTHPELIYGLFFGLIVGSIYILYKAMPSVGWMEGFFVMAGTLIGFWVVTLVPADTPESLWFIFLSGSIAICAMILPGISGSYILLILRKYDYILAQVAAVGDTETLRALIVLGVFLMGAVIGIALFSRFLSWLLNRYYAPTLAILIGFLIGSLYIIWPYQERTYEEHLTKTEVVSSDDPRVTELREDPPSRNRPTYERIGESVQADGENKVEIETVSRKLIKSDPFVPSSAEERTNPRDFWSGIIGMVIGLGMVGGLDYLRRKS